ncbi:MAG: iron-containing alcohol dehydrogenase [Eubacteriaceae bacterium]|jgi:4-hydroxybutyrate dehydrogenase|nr:iron-containing alcohol dehydrogenase [Eubacteriaceae bacterium]
MRELFLFPEVQSYGSFAEFAGDHQIGKHDLIVTSEPILPNFKKDIPQGTNTICVEKYGKGEPTDVMFEELQADAAAAGFDRVISVGGGSCIDISKMLCVADGRNLDEVFEADPSELKHNKTLIVIPTTCGTGSEVTVTAVFDRTRKGTKMGLTSYALHTDFAVMIPSLLSTLPASVFATSSIDALIHAVESYTDAAQATNGSRMFAEKAISMILPIYRHIKDEGMDNRSKYIYEMQLASLYAGVAIANALPSASHAMGYPFAGKFHRPHGEACYVFLDVTLKKYLADVRVDKVDNQQKKDWSNMMQIIASGMGMEGADDEAVLNSMDELLGFICPRKRLSEYGASPEDCIAFGKSCWEQQQRLLSCAFSPYTEEELIEAFKSVY